MLSTLIGVIIILFVVLFFISLLVISITAFVKGNKSLGYTFLTMFLVVMLFLGYLFLSKSNFKNDGSINGLTSNEAKDILRKEKIILNDSVSMISHKYENDLYFYRLQFSVKISTDDYMKISNGELERDFIFQDLTKEEQQIHDTLKINLTKDKILHFYKCQYDTNN